jgi:hypothetical protein
MNEEEVMEKAPPGMEDVVLALKKKFPGQEGRAYAIAWDQYNKKHGKKSTNESLDRKEAIMENALVYIIKNHPHEHKMAQDGWGLPENLYQALCDYYHDNGSVPREVWHGDSQALRDWVEECYMKDSSELMENPALLAAIPAALGTAARAIPAVVSGAARTLASPTVGGAMARTAASTALNAISSDGNDEVQEAGVMKPSDRFSDEIPEPEMDVAKMSTFTTPTFIRKQMAAGRKPQFPVTTPVKSDTSELERSLKDSVQTMEEDYMSESKLDEKYMGFNKTVASIKKSGSAENPEAVAAAIGRKKYGKEKFQKAAAAGKKLGETSDDSMMENWENQLNTLLNEGMTITTSTGNEGASDSVSISATDADAQTLMKLLQGAGLTGGKSSMHSVSADQAPSMTVTPVSSDEVMGTLEPQDDGGEEAMGFLKRMIGARASGSSDYSDEEHEETDSEDSGDEESHDHDEHECESCGMSEEVCECGVNEDEVEEGNKFTGNLAKARAAGKKEADLDGDGDMEKVREEEEMCNECGMHESKCGCEHDEEHLNEWANSPDGQSEDEQFATEMEYMTKLLSGGLNNMKRNQTVMPSTEVDVSPDLFRKLAGI